MGLCTSYHQPLSHLSHQYRPASVKRLCAHPWYSRSLVTKKKSPLEKDNSWGAFARRDSTARITLSGMKLLAEAGFDRIAALLDIGVDMFVALASRDRRIRNDMLWARMSTRGPQSRSFSNSKRTTAQHKHGPTQRRAIPTLPRYRFCTPAHFMTVNYFA